MNRYQPESGHRPIAADEPLYSSPLRTLTAVRLDITRVRSKFKLHQDRPTEIRAHLAEQLRLRNRHDDHWTATAISNDHHQ